MKKIAHLKSFKTKNLDNNKIKQICKLKMQHYNFSLDKQKKWFKEIIKKDFIHNMFYIDKKLIGYNCLRTFYIKDKLKFLLFDTIVIDKKFRKLGYSEKIIKKINQLIKKNKVFGLLLCKKSMKNYYQNFGWKVLKKNKIIKLKEKKICMTYKYKNNFKYLLSHAKSHIEII